MNNRQNLNLFILVRKQIKHPPVAHPKAKNLLLIQDKATQPMVDNFLSIIPQPPQLHFDTFFYLQIK